MNPMITAIFIFLAMNYFLAQEHAIEGYWLSETGEGKVKIYQGKNGQFYGKLIWLKEPLENGVPRKDFHNKNNSLRDQPLIGKVLLKGFTKTGNSYTGGTIYDPENGKTYSCKINQLDKDRLEIRGYIGISLIGRTTIWTRTKPEL